MTSPKSLKERFEKYVVCGNGCWLWSGHVDKDGYGRIRQGSKSEPLLRSHRVSYELYVGSIPPGMMVCHSCDNPPCVRPSHLFIGSAVDNVRDMIFKKRDKIRGSSQSQSKLSDSDVRDIRLFSPMITQKSLASHFGVSQGLISHVLTGNNWRHVA